MVDFVAVASEAVFEAAAVVLEVVLEAVDLPQVDLLVGLGREELQQAVEVGHIPIDLVILDDTTIEDRGIDVGGILHGGVIIIGLGITHPFMLGAV